MLRESEVPIERSVNPAELGWSSETALASKEYFNRCYQDMRGLTWDDASRVLMLEQEIIARCAGDLSAASESISDGESASLYDLDLGVAAAVAALSAAKCAPISSCNGSPGHNEAYPLVAFYCRKGRVRDIVKVAELTDCGLHNGDSGTLVVYAGNVQRLMNFAQALIERRNRLALLSRPQRARRSPNKDQRQLTLDLYHLPTDALWWTPANDSERPQAASRALRLGSNLTGQGEGL